MDEAIYAELCPFLKYGLKNLVPLKSLEFPFYYY